MSITQVRSNFSGKMVNNTDEASWMTAQLQSLIDSGEVVVVVLRQPPGSDKKTPYATQVPFYVRWQRLQESASTPSRIDERLQNIDLAPTPRQGSVAQW